MRNQERILLALSLLLLMPWAASAQGGAGIAGIVKDASGAVMPGVTVEAASPALIEKTRTVITDGTGQYTIVSLLPGTYTVTFTLSGFNAFTREGIELTGDFVATVNAEMKVGNVAETVTVTGATPIVDVQSVRVQTVVTKQVVDAIPTGRLGTNLAVLQPGMILASGAGAANTNNLTAQDVGGTLGDTFADLSINGSKAAEQRTSIGGLSVATNIRFGEQLASALSFTAFQEMSVDSAGADASMTGGGVRMNYIPRDGGNAFNGLFFVTGANPFMQASNFSACDVDPATVNPNVPGSGTCIVGQKITSLQYRGLKSGALQRLSKVYDVNPGFGGPIKKDRLWFFLTARWTLAEQTVQSNYPNRNFVVGQTDPRALNPTTVTYSPDLTQPLRLSTGGNGDFKEQTARLTWQVSPKHKLGFYYDNKKRTTGLNANAGTSREALSFGYFFPFSDQLVQWTAPMTSRLLLEAGLWHHQETWGGAVAPFDEVDPFAIGIVDCAPNSNVLGYSQLVNAYHGRGGTCAGGVAATAPVAMASHNPNFRSNVAASYVTGAHAFKAGLDMAGGDRWAYTTSISPYVLGIQTSLNSRYGTPVPIGTPVPSSILLRSDGVIDPLTRFYNGAFHPGATTLPSDLSANNIRTAQRIRMDGGAYVQDKWTMNHVTLYGGVRFDYFKSDQPEQSVGPSLLTPNRNVAVPYFVTMEHKDLTPKMGAAWDVFGDGRTALKVNFSKYVLGQAFGVSGQLPSQVQYNIQTTSSRTWQDTNGNFVPDCDLANPAAQGPNVGSVVVGQLITVEQPDVCLPPMGPNALFYNTTIGQYTAQVNVDDDARYGWGKRAYSWEFSVSAQRQLTSGVSVTGGYARRWFGNFLVTDNLAATANDFTTFSVAAGSIPAAPPTAGGQTLPGDAVTTGFYNINLSGPSNNFQGRVDTFFPGSHMIDHFNGFTLSLNARLPQGAILQGGVNTGRQTLDNCDIVDPGNAGKFGDRSPLVELLGGGTNSSLSVCHVDYAWLTQLKFLGSYTVPKIDVQVGAAYQNIPGVEMAATYADALADAMRPVSQGGLGRPIAGGLSSINVSLVKPGTLYAPRLNQIDLRFGKVVRYGKTRSLFSLDIFNVLNVDTVTGLNPIYIQTWLTPTGIVAPRLIKISTTIDF